MATSLPARNIFDGTANPTTGTMKAAKGSLRDYLAERFGEGDQLMMPALNGGALAGLRNRIINGDCVQNERAGGSSVNITAGGGVFYGAVDRFAAQASGGTAVSSRVAISGGRFRSRLTGASGNTAVAQHQNIEARNVCDLADAPFSLGVDILCSVTTTVTWQVYYPNASNNFSAVTLGDSGSLSVAAGVVARHEVENLIAPAASVQNGMQVRFTIPGGLGAGQTFDIGDLQVEAGKVATPFERIPASLQQANCQRYAERLNRAAINTYTTTGAGFSVHMPWKVTKFQSPAVTYGNVAYFNASGVTLAPGTTDLFVGAVATTTGVTSVDLTGIVADAELR